MESPLINKHLALPKQWHEGVAQDQKQLSVIKQNLANAIAIGDLHAFMFYNRQLSKLIPLTTIGAKDAVEIVQILLKVFVNPQLHESQALQMCANITNLLKKLKKADKSVVNGFHVEWKPLWEVFEKLVKNNTNIFRGKQRNNILHLFQLISTSRKFFLPSSAKELLEKLKGTLNVHDSSILLHAGFFASFISAQHLPWSSQLVTDLLDMASWLPNNTRWKRLWISVFGKAIKHTHAAFPDCGAKQLSTQDKSRLIVYIMESWIEMTGVNIGRGNSNNSHGAQAQFSNALLSGIAGGWLWNNEGRPIANAIVYTLSSDVQSWEYLIQLIESLRIYFYPSNSGSWTDFLANLLMELTQSYCVRIKKERETTIVLTESHHIKFASLLYEVAVQALFSKSNSMSVAAQDSLRNLMHIYPDLVFTLLSKVIFPALDTLTATHQTTAALDVLAPAIDILTTRVSWDPVKVSAMESDTPFTLPEEYQPHMRTLSTFSMTIDMICNTVLASINSNDGNRSRAAFKVLLRIFSIFPLKALKTTENVSGIFFDPNGDDSMTSDWSLRFLETIFQYLSAKDEEEKSQDKNKPDTVLELFKMCTKTFFQQQSPSVFKETLPRLVDFVYESKHKPALKEMCHLMSCATFSNPSVALDKIIPIIHGKLVKNSKLKSDLSEDEISYSLSLLQACLSVGPSILTHVKPVTEIITLTIDHDDSKNVSKLSSKCLLALLSSLILPFPTELKSLNPNLWEQLGKHVISNGKDLSHVYRGAFVRNLPEEIGIQWTNDSVAMETAAQMVVFYREKAEKILSNLQKTQKAKNTVKNGMYLVKALFLGAGPVTNFLLGNSPFPGISKESSEENEEKSLPLAKYRPSCSFMVTSSWSSLGDLHTWAAQLLLHTGNFIEKSFPDDVALAQFWTRKVKIFARPTGVQADNPFGPRRFFAFALRERFRDFTKHFSTKILYPRVLIAEVWHSRLFRRLNEGNFGLKLVPGLKEILDLLWTFSTSIYRTLRTSSQNSLISLSKSHPKAVEYLAPKVLIALSTTVPKSEPQNIDERRRLFAVVKAAIHVISSHEFQSKIAKNWKNTEKLFSSVISSSVFEEQELQIEFFTRFLGALANFKAPFKSVITGMDVGHAVTVSKEQISAFVSNLAIHSENNQKAFAGFAVNACKAFDTSFESSKHWKYQLTVALLSICMIFLPVIQTKPNLDPQVLLQMGNSLFVIVKFGFEKGITHDIAPMRSLFSSLLTFLLEKAAKGVSAFGTVHLSDLNDKSASVSATQVLQYLQNPITPKDSDNIVFFDKNEHGWLGSYAPSSFLSSGTISKPENSQENSIFGKILLPIFQNLLSSPSKDHLYTLTKLQAQDHMFKQATTSSNTQIPAFLSSIIPHHMLAAANMASQGTSIENLVGTMKDSLFASSNAKLTSGSFQFFPSSSMKGFSPSNANLWKGLLLASGNILTGPVRQFIDSRVQEILSMTSDESDDILVAMEMLAGLFRSAKKVPFSVQEQLWVSGPFPAIFSKAVQTSTNDLIPEWSSFFRFCFRGFDPRRVERLLSGWLDATTIDSVLHSSTLSSLQQLKYLIFIQSILAELSWRGMKWILGLIPVLTKHMGHPYQQVRKVIAELLAVLMASTWYPAFAGVKVGMTEAFATELHQKLTVALKSDLSEDDVKLASRIRETTLQFASFSLTSNRNMTVVSFLPSLFRHIVLMERDKDQEVSKLARQTLLLVVRDQFPSVHLPHEQLINAVIDLSTSENWHTRSAILPVIQIFMFNFQFQLSVSDKTKLQNVVLKSLDDPQVEVRELARSALTSILISSGHHQQLSGLIHLFQTKAGEPKKNDSPVQQHSGVLGMCAIVLTAPYSVPTWMPPLLVKLAKYSTSPNSGIRESVKTTFGEFWRTHKDSWDLLKDAFTPDQLSVVSQQNASSNYYA